MSDLSALDATVRAGTGKGAARAARREGRVPGVVYGAGESPVAISVNYNALLKELRAGKFMSTLHTLKVGDAESRVICRAVQRDVVKDLPVHVDFQRLTQRSRVKLYIPVEFLNQETCPGLKKGGTLNVVRHEVELDMQAGAIPEQIEVDLAEAQIGDSLKISDVALPKGVKPTITDRDFVIATIASPSGLAAADDDEEGGEEDEGAETEE